MILDSKIEVNMNSFTLNHYNNLGYDYKVGEKFIINVNELPKGSNHKINVSCDVCGKNYILTYKRYMYNTKNGTDIYTCYGKCSNVKRIRKSMEKYGVENPFQNKEIKEKIKETNLEKHGVNYPSQSKEIKKKIEKSFIKKYGVKNPFQYDEIKEDIREKTRKTKKERGLINHDGSFDVFHNYKRKVVLLTRNLKKKYLEKWNGRDYYDNEIIKDNFNKYDIFDENYPNFDHIISIRYGFDNGMGVNEIASIDNLCITKRKHNMSKYTKTKVDFLKNMDK